LVPRPHSSHRLHRPLVRPPGSQRIQLARRLRPNRIRRRRLVGAHRRLRPRPLIRKINSPAQPPYLLRLKTVVLPTTQALNEQRSKIIKSHSAQPAHRVVKVKFYMRCQTSLPQTRAAASLTPLRSLASLSVPSGLSPAFLRVNLLAVAVASAFPPIPNP